MKAGVTGKAIDAGLTAMYFTAGAWLTSHEKTVHDFLVDVPQECVAYTSVALSHQPRSPHLHLTLLKAWTTLQKLFQQAGGKQVCEVSRYLLPTKWLHTTFDGVAGWMSTEVLSEIGGCGGTVANSRTASCHVVNALSAVTQSGRLLLRTVDWLHLFATDREAFPPFCEMLC